MNDDLWIIEWQDRSGDPDHDIKDVARGPEDAVERLRQILHGITVVDEDAVRPDGDYPPEAERPAFDVLFEGEDPVAALRDLDEEIEQETEEGTIVVTPC
jgi:hypothetical protein